MSRIWFSAFSKSIVVRNIQLTGLLMLRSMPILLPVLLVSILMVFTDQGSGLLTLTDNAYLPRLLCVLGLIAGLFSHYLAPRIGGYSRDSKQLRRQYWYAQWSASLIVGVTATTLIPCFVEFYLGSDLSQSLPDEARKELHECALYTAFVSAIIFFGVVVIHFIKRQTRSAELEIGTLAVFLLLLVGCLIGYLVPNYAARMAFATLVPLNLVLWPLVLSKEATPYPPDAISSEVKAFCGILCFVGFVLCIWPGKLMDAGSFDAGVIALIFCISVFVAMEWIWLFLYRRYPLRTLMLSPIGLGVLLAVLAGGLFTARSVRELTSEPAAVAGANRQSLSSYVQQWLDARADELTADNARPYPVYIVAAPGGGIRAAYWTAGVLSALQDMDNGFARHILAISGVSGGAVGAGIFAALVKSECKSQSKDETAPERTRECQTRAARILANDFLAPTIYSMFSRDLATKLFPSIPDRAAALEEAFERGWRTEMHSEILAQRFDDMWSSDGRTAVPGLFFNVTDAGSGDRLVLGPAAVPRDASVPADRALLQRALEDKVFRLSTAMVLGARFPFVSPEGFVTSGTASNGGSRKLRLVDGGLSDNSGLETVSDILNAVAAAKPPSKIRVYVLNIENNPLPEDTQQNIGPFRAPLLLYLRMVAKLTAASKQELTLKMSEIGNTAVLNEVRPKGGKSVFLLGWTLPRTVRLDMDEQINALAKLEQGPLACIRAELAGSSAKPSQEPVSSLSPDSKCPPVKEPGSN